MSSEARPFLKWVGGKRQLLPAILEHLPKPRGVYYEPFIGGAAVFFALAPEHAVLGDVNLRLVRTYRGVRDDVDGVIRRLGELIPSSRAVTREEYKDVVSKQDGLKTDVETAAWLIFVNRLGFNGVYRENKAGGFNTPWNKSKRPTVIDAKNLRACSLALARADIVHGDFRELLAYATEGDVVYCDPPYIPASKTANFTAYTKAGFGPADQERLRDEAAEAAWRGARVVLSNNLNDRVAELYGGPPFLVHAVGARRSVNCKPDKRGAVDEAIIVAGPGGSDDGG